MRRKLTAIALASAFALALPAATASAAIDEGPGKGNPDTNPDGQVSARTEPGHITRRTEEVPLAPR